MIKKIITASLPETFKTTFNKNLLDVKVPSLITGVPVEFNVYKGWHKREMIKEYPLKNSKSKKHKIKAGVNHRYLMNKHLMSKYAEYVERKKKFKEMMDNPKMRLPRTSGTTLTFKRYNDDVIKESE